MRVTRAYRTVSFEAATLIASMLPITMLAKEQTVARNAANRAQALKVAPKESMKKWQQEWDNTNKGRWTHRLIRDVEKWANRGHDYIDYNLTQALTNHGYFNAYLCKIKKVNSPKCSCYDADVDDANHTLFNCDTFEIWRRQLSGEIGHTVTPDNLVDLMLQEGKKWQLIQSYVNRVMKFKCEAGDFTAKSTLWSSSSTDSKGDVLEIFTASLGLWVNNCGNMPNFSRVNK